MHARLVLLLLSLMVAGATSAVSLSIDQNGQVLLLPLYRVGASNQTLLEIRNTDTAAGRAVRVVTKDPINGRPSLSFNLYLGPSDSWSGALYDPSGAESAENAQASLARWVDDSCTFPALDDVPPEGLKLDGRHMGENLDAIVLSNRLRTGFIEIYEMGGLDADLSVDCASIGQRWETGPWSDGVTAIQNEGVSRPRGGLEAYAAVINLQSGLSYHFEALALDDFRNAPLHTHPDNPRHPNLADVLPAESRVLESVVFANRTIQVERVSSWRANPVNAIDALLMTVSSRTDFSSNADIGAVSAVVLTLPTRAYHTDLDNYYGGPRQLAPFVVNVPPTPEQDLRDNLLRVTVLDRSGFSVALNTNPGTTDCDLVNGSVTTVFMTRQFGFDFTCEFTRAEFRVHSTVVEGEMSFAYDGEIVSDEGHVYRGLPVYGVLLQSLVNNNLPSDRNILTVANYGWSRVMKRQREISDPE